MEKKKLQKGVDYYIEEQTGYYVFTALYLLKRGYCCENNCRHCPYKKDTTDKNLDERKNNLSFE